MPPRLPAPIQRIGLNIFRRLPPSIRRRAIHAGTPNFTVGAVLLLRDDDGRVLLVRQRHTRRVSIERSEARSESTAGWSLPGGLLGHGESPREAVVREVFEELGMRLDAGDVAEAVPHALVNPHSRRVDIVFTLARGTEASGTVSADGIEILEIRWFAPDDLPRCTRGTYLVLTRCGVVPPSS